VRSGFTYASDIAVSVDGTLVLISGETQPPGDRQSWANMVTVVDASEMKVTGSVVISPVLDRPAPADLAVSPDGSMAYLVDRGNDEASSLLRILSSDALSTVATARLPDLIGSLLVPRRTGLVHVIGAEDVAEVGFLTTLDERGTEAVIGPRFSAFSQFSVSTEQDAVVSPDGSTLYALESVVDLPSFITVVDLGSGTKVAQFDVGIRPQAVELSPDGSSLYVIYQGAPKLSVLDSTTGALTKEMEFLPPGYSPQSIRASSNGQYLHVLAYPWTEPEGLPVSVFTIDTATWETVATPLGDDLFGALDMEPSPDGARLYIRVVKGETGADSELLALEYR
jgi:DNA-binding beta-propeller fold protein YncE